MKAKFTLIRPKEEGSDQAEVETFEIANIEHIPPNRRDDLPWRKGLSSIRGHLELR